MNDESYLNIEALNKELSQENGGSEQLDVLNGLEILLEAFNVRMEDILGRKALLAINYQIGAEPAEKISKRILESRNQEKFEDPIEAFIVFFKELKKYFSIQLKKIEKSDDGSITLHFENTCFFRQTISRRKGLTIGGTLCRISKGYVETAMKHLTNYKADITLVEKKDSCCLEKLILVQKKEK
ncbi:MAG: hypothetical protein ACTSVI_05880 [Promethearchaeota archaeon]